MSEETLLKFEFTEGVKIDWVNVCLTNEYHEISFETHINEDFGFLRNALHGKIDQVKLIDKNLSVTLKDGRIYLSKPVKRIVLKRNNNNNKYSLNIELEH